jgi:hypothetical protein
VGSYRCFPVCPEKCCSAMTRRSADFESAISGKSCLSPGSLSLKSAPTWKLATDVVQPRQPLRFEPVGIGHSALSPSQRPGLLGTLLIEYAFVALVSFRQSVGLDRKAFAPQDSETKPPRIPQRKAHEKLAVEFSGAFSPVQF